MEQPQEPSGLRRSRPKHRFLTDGHSRVHHVDDDSFEPDERDRHADQTTMGSSIRALRAKPATTDPIRPPTVADNVLFCRSSTPTKSRSRRDAGDPRYTQGSTCLSAHELHAVGAAGLHRRATPWLPVKTVQSYRDTSHAVPSSSASRLRFARYPLLLTRGR